MSKTTTEEPGMPKTYPRTRIYRYKFNGIEYDVRRQRREGSNFALWYVMKMRGVVSESAYSTRNEARDAAEEHSRSGKWVERK